MILHETQSMQSLNIVTGRKQYAALDLMKFLMALLILTQHTSNEWAHSIGLLHAFFGLGNFAVPFFFACSGYLFFIKYDELNDCNKFSYYKKWSIRVWKMYLVWSLIYFVFIFINWIKDGFDSQLIWDWIHGALVYSTYATIWFLPALWVGISMCLFLNRHVKFEGNLVIILVIWIIGNLFGSYSNIISCNKFFYDINEDYIRIFITWRNGFFNGTPYAFIGYMVHRHNIDNPNTPNLTTSISLAIIFSLSFILEAFAIVQFKLGNATDMGFMIGPSTYFILIALVKWKLKENPVFLLCRHLSMLVFLAQRLFLTAIPSVIPSYRLWVLNLPEFLIYTYFIVITLTFSLLIEQLSRKYRFLKVLW